MRLVESFCTGLADGLKHLPEVLGALKRIPGQLCTLLSYWRRVGCRCLRLRVRCGDEIHVPPEVHRRADPLLYSQSWLMGMGLAVTWDNPDIQLYLNGSPVPSSQLAPGTEYEVRVRVWNNSYDTPAPGLPVHLRYLGFGTGTDGVYLGKRLIDLGAKATSQCPAFASFAWKTPSTAGHYCLQASLDWPDDANPQNNLGQENTNVGTTASPAEFTFAVKNRASVRREFTFEVDDYTLPEKEPCEEPAVAWEERGTRIEESRRRWASARQAQGYGQFDGWKNDWKVEVDPPKLVLGAGQETAVEVSIEPANPHFTGSKPFNVNVFAVAPDAAAPRELVGGVTLVVEGG